MFTGYGNLQQCLLTDNPRVAGSSPVMVANNGLVAELVDARDFNGRRTYTDNLHLGITDLDTLYAGRCSFII